MEPLTVSHSRTRERREARLKGRQAYRHSRELCLIRSEKIRVMMTAQSKEAAHEKTS